MFEIAVVNDQSVVEPLKFYCIYIFFIMGITVLKLVIWGGKYS